MEYLILIAGLTVLALVVGGVLFLRPGRKPRPPVEPPAPPDATRGGTVTVEEEDQAAPTVER
ncbi:MAG: signal recognition particle-docking protein FtsY, partial [Actinomadura rubrobrunea]|nr:signal recognition particle-docking protein FtsY [Actinomadura rubrobrunea]